MVRSTCQACGKLNPQFAVGKSPKTINPVDRFREIPGIKPFVYPPKQLLCVSCRFAPTLPGKLSNSNQRKVFIKGGIG